MKDILLIKKTILILITLAFLSSCSEPEPLRVKAQIKVNTTSLDQSVATCCSKKPNRFALGTTSIKLRK